MSPDPEIGRASSCEGKRRYSNRKHARQARNRTPGGGGHLHIYRCTFCGFFHLGHMPADVNRGRVSKDDWKRRRGA